MRRWLMLMNVEGGSNGGGTVTPPAAAGAPPAAAPQGAPAAAPAPGLDLTQLTQTLAGINQQIQRQGQALAHLMSGGAQQRPAEEPEDADPLDPTTAKALQTVQQSSAMQYARIQDQLDLNSFKVLVEKTKPSEELMARAGQIWNDWTTQGRVVRNAQGQDVLPTRYEALQLAMGEFALAGKPVVPVPNQDEAARLAQNATADVHRPGVLRVVRVDATLPDPDKMTPAERVDKYHSSLLDADGGW